MGPPYKAGNSLIIGKKLTLYPSAKKCKNVVQNYRIISLLPNFGKKLKSWQLTSRLIAFIKTKYLLNVNLACNTAISLLSSSVHDIDSLFDCYPPPVRGIFLDISKAFDKAWDKGLLFKLKHSAKGEILNLPLNYLHERQQKAILNDHISSWELPQRSVLD